MKPYMKRHPIYTRYSVTKDGRVYSHIYNKFLKPSLTGERVKYFTLNLREKMVKHPKMQKVHILVLETYIGLRPKNCEAAHLDGDCLNNSLKNLKWVKPKINTHHRQVHGRAAVKLNEHQVLEIRRDFKKIGRRSNAEKLAKKYKVSRQAIDNIINRRTWGYI